MAPDLDFRTAGLAQLQDLDDAAMLAAAARDDRILVTRGEGLLDEPVSTAEIGDHGPLLELPCRSANDLDCAFEVELSEVLLAKHRPQVSLQLPPQFSYSLG